MYGGMAVICGLTMGWGGLLIGPLIMGVAGVVADREAANKEAARERDIERRTRYHYHYRGD